ncbi:MAG: hypothetical protein JWM12_1063 [Ilumatobacteraceae bacterium]|nr:hypothetical protein [Ilumatobacteraceae bacterium]
MSTETNTTDLDAVEPSPTGSRRALLGKGAMAAAVAATAGLAVSRNASAATGAPLVMGVPLNDSAPGTTDTGLIGGSSLVVTDGKTSGSGSGASLVGASVVGKQTVAARVGTLGSNTGENGFGLWGEHTSTTVAGTGVFGASSNGPGVVARGTVADLEADGSGRLIFTKDAFAGVAPTGTSVVGTLARDVDGSLWYSPKAGTWVKLASVTSAASAGSFHVVAPVRVYDSRLAAPTQGKLSTGQSRVVSIADARNEVSGLVTTANVVPVGATAVVANLTVTETEGELGGFLSVVPGDATALSGSSINWSGPNQNIANGLTAKIAADRTVKVFCGGIPTPRTHFVIDVSGYWI